MLTDKDLLTIYAAVRKRTEELCVTLTAEDYVLQPVEFVSPPKWHLAHTTWFFETFVLMDNLKGYRAFDNDYNFLFNSYYETVGERLLRADRGNLSRPPVADIYRYRAYVDDAMARLLASPLAEGLDSIIELGLNHEEQHQELLCTDIKYILGHNPLFPAFGTAEPEVVTGDNGTFSIPSGTYEVGYNGDGFCFDNELDRHTVYLGEYELSKQLVTNGEYLEFINDGGYIDHRHWHQEGLEWVRAEKIGAPMYWHKAGGQWQHYTPAGLMAIPFNEPVTHISFYEAAAFAAWKGMRLPTEFEWEVASDRLEWGRRWEWTNSAYLPYPGYKKAAGALGEYNGKFMINQMVLRGASVATPPGHSRPSYRNFFHPWLRWQYTGIRLAQ
jgi:ergothioneine biosynthesis protein EgtB